MIVHQKYFMKERWFQIELLTNDNYLTNVIPSGKVIHCTDGDITIA